MYTIKLNSCRLPKSDCSSKPNLVAYKSADIGDQFLFIVQTVDSTTTSRNTKKKFWEPTVYFCYVFRTLEVGLPILRILVPALVAWPTAHGPTNFERPPTLWELNLIPTKTFVHMTKIRRMCPKKTPFPFMSFNFVLAFAFLAILYLVETTSDISVTNFAPSPHQFWV